MHRILFTLGVALAVLMTAGCAPTPATEVASIPLPVVEKLSDAALAELAEQDQAAALEFLLRQFPDATAPVVERERFIEPEESVTVIPNCLTEQGFPTVGGADGSWTTETRTQDVEKLGLARYTCSMKFPVNPKYSARLNESQIAYIYNYQTQILTPCLEDAGYTVDAPPSLEDFVASYFSSEAGWQPYEHVNAGGLTASLYVQCPQSPEHLFG